MTLDNLSTTNVWLGIIATVTLIEFLMLVVGGVLAFRLYKKINGTIDEVKEKHIAPIAAKVDHIVAEVQEVTARVRRADDAVRSAVGRVEDGVGRVLSLTRHGWPVMAGWRAVSAAVGTFVRRGPVNDVPRPIAATPPRLAPRPITSDAVRRSAASAASGADTRRAADAESWRTH